MKNSLKFTVAAAVLAAALPAPRVSAGNVLDDAVKVVAAQAKSKKTAKSKSEQKKPAAKVDNFIDENHDGVDDRKVRRVVKPEPVKPAAEDQGARSREAKAPAPKESTPDTAAPKAKPPR